MTSKYKPINCDFHELLLAKATLKQVCRIIFVENSKQKSIKTIITDVYTKKGEEFMVLKSGETIRLDKIISINNDQMPYFNCTFSVD